MTYNVFGGTLNIAQLNSVLRQFDWLISKSTRFRS